MSFEIPGFSFTLDAAADLSTHQHKAVVVDGNGRAALAGTQGVMVAGILQNKPNALGVAAAILHSGITKMVASAAISRGAKVTTTNAGKAVTSASTNITLGVALEAATADGQVIAVLLGNSHVTP